MVGREVGRRTRVQLTVARDVHDVAGHALGVIGAEAGVTRSLPDATEQELRDSLAGIERHARGGLAQARMRPPVCPQHQPRILGCLGQWPRRA
jgi:hypothetical protein